MPMSLKVIGTGQGRTGTASLKFALEQLGFGKCYHMFELFEHPEQVKYFEQAHKTGNTNWDELLEGYQSAVDFPIIRYYKQLMEKYPDAKVIHTTRDPEAWYKSASDTIFWASKPSIGRILKLVVQLPFNSMVRRRVPILKHNGTMMDEVYGKDLKDKQEVIKRFNRFNDEVLNTVPKDRLLVYDVKSGWEPLCKFLNVPVPSTPFPKANNTDEFLGRVKKISTGVEKL